MAYALVKKDKETGKVVELVASGMPYSYADRWAQKWYRPDSDIYFVVVNDNELTQEGFYQ